MHIIAAAAAAAAGAGAGAGPRALSIHNTNTPLAAPLARPPFPTRHRRSVGESRRSQLSADLTVRPSTAYLARETITKRLYAFTNDKTI